MTCLKLKIACSDKKDVQEYTTKVIGMVQSNLCQQYTNYIPNCRYLLSNYCNEWYIYLTCEKVANSLVNPVNEKVTVMSVQNIFSIDWADEEHFAPDKIKIPPWQSTQPSFSRPVVPLVLGKLLYNTSNFKKVSCQEIAKRVAGFVSCGELTIVEYKDAHFELTFSHPPDAYFAFIMIQEEHVSDLHLLL